MIKKTKLAQYSLYKRNFLTDGLANDSNKNESTSRIVTSEKILSSSEILSGNYLR